MSPTMPLLMALTLVAGVGCQTTSGHRPVDVEPPARTVRTSVDLTPRRGAGWAEFMFVRSASGLPPEPDVVEKIIGPNWRLIRPGERKDLGPLLEDIRGSAGLTVWSMKALHFCDTQGCKPPTKPVKTFVVAWPPSDEPVDPAPASDFHFVTIERPMRASFRQTDLPISVFELLPARRRLPAECRQGIKCESCLPVGIFLLCNEPMPPGEPPRSSAGFTVDLEPR